jgi:hypothetical protein
MLWTTFLLQVVASLFLFACCIYVHFRVTQLANNQPTMQTSEDRARTHIQSETDIEQLRSSALHVLNASDITWSGFLKTMGYVDIAIWGFFIATIAFATLSGFTIYALRVQSRGD